MASSAEIRDLSDRYLLDVYPRKVMNIVMANGDGVCVTDLDGKSYLDFAGANGVNILGYKHPAVMKAALSQLNKIVQSGNYFYNLPQAYLAQKLCKLSGLNKCFFSNSGAESVEAAIKVARRYGHRVKNGAATLICFENAWHGRTLATISATGSKTMQKDFAPLVPGFKIVPDWDFSAIEGAIDSSTIGVMCEPIIGHGGLYPAPENFLRELRMLCNSKGLLLILDEVQTALGRTGTFFNFEQHDTRPDILCLAKGLGSGFPIGATLFTESAAQYMDVGSHGTATGGNPLSTAVALAVVETITTPGFLAEAAEKGRLLTAQLTELLSKLPGHITAVRSSGLLAAFDIRADSQEALKTFASNGLLLTRVSTNCIRMLPPLIVTNDEIKEAISLIEKSLLSI